MTLAATDYIYSEPKSGSQSLAVRIGLAVVALTFLSSFYVKIEPAPCDILFFVALPFFYRSGVHLSRVLMPLFTTLLIYNVSGVVSYTVLDDDPYGSWLWMSTLFYMGISALFYSALVAADPIARFQFISKFYYAGATIASAMALLGYFKLVPENLEFVVNGRAAAGFKDGNVFSTYIIFPAVYMLQQLVLGKSRMNLINLVSLALILMALIVAFSRGAWINFSLAAIFTFAFTVLLSPSRNQQGKLLFKAAIAIGAVVLILVALLSIKETADLFWDRFTLVKSYDAGETGRFGNQLNSIPMLLSLPFGFGPLQFAKYFDLAPHNTFLNAYSSFGWIGGSAYLALVAMNIFVGFRLIIKRSPFQASAIAVVACLFSVTFQGVQIDTEHWRHVYWLVGMMWGLFAAMAEGERQGWSERSILAGWNVAKRPN